MENHSPMEKLVVGVDVGGTNTDAVILKGNEVVASVKHPTTSDRTSGVRNAIENVIKNLVQSKSQSEHTSRVDVIKCIKRVNIGTTHFVNALIERKNLEKVGVIRLCGSASRALPPFTDFPENLRRVLDGGCALVQGGYECTHKEIAGIDQQEIVQNVQQLWNNGVRNFVISGVFSPLVHHHEIQAAEMIAQAFPDASVTLSHSFNQFGLLERENAAILNESLKTLCCNTISAFRKALDEIGFVRSCPFFLSQNDGTLISETKAKELPVLTISSGPTNSMRGAAFLSGVEDAVVIDIGGTTTDVGVIKSGFPREASGYSKLPGVNVRTKFRHPDVISIGLGGGSIIRSDSSNNVQVGPDSVGHKLEQEALAFGGNVVTATDIAMVTGLLAPFGSASVPETIRCQTVYAASMQIYKMIRDTIDAIKTTAKDVPVLLVGGGSVLVDTENWVFKGVSSLKQTPHFDVANAVGAAIGQISGEYRDMVTLSADLTRDQLIKRSIEQAINAAIVNGADPSSARDKEKSVKEKSVDPVPYVGEGGNVVVVYIKVVGNLQQDCENKPVASKPDSSVTASSEVPDPMFERKDNPNWPYVNEEVLKLDKQYGLPEPTINSAGEWVLSVHDVECLCTGAGILGCGGGGNPYLGELLAKKEISEGKEIRVVNPFRFDSPQDGLSLPIASMGAPTIDLEKLVAGTETLNAMEGIKKLLVSGVCEKANDFGRKSAGGLEVKQSSKYPGVYQAFGLDKISLPQDDSRLPPEMRITSLLCSEIGGMNSVEPLLLGAKCGLPVLDADGMGRAFPELQMYIPFIYGYAPYPCCVADNKGRVDAVSYCETPKLLENVMRDSCIEMGLTCAISPGHMTLSDVKKVCVLLTISKAWCLGRAVHRAQLAKTDPVMAVTSSMNGKLVISGKIIDVHRATEGGFSRGYLVVQGLGNFSGTAIKVLFQNENLVVHRHDDNNDNTSIGQILVTTPDLITVIDSERGEPVTTEEVKYGIRVAVVAMAADPQLKTERALKVVGPRAFGYDFDYTSFTKINNH